VVGSGFAQPTTCAIIEPKYIKIEALNGLQNPEIIILYNQIKLYNHPNLDPLQFLHEHARHFNSMPLEGTPPMSISDVVEVAASHAGYMHSQ
jgi:hypothetical protein